METLERMSRNFAIFLFGVYGVGFLVVSLHHFQYGFTDLNLLRPRILSAGSWFVILAGIPAWFAYNLREKIADRYTGMILASIYLAGCAFLAFSFVMIFNISNDLSVRLFVTIYGVAILCTVGLMLADRGRLPKWLVGGFSLLSCALLLIQAAENVFGKGFTAVSLLLWFFFVGAVSVVEARTAERQKGNGVNVVTPLITVLASIMIFSFFYYPHIKPSLGGGAPVPVTIYVSKESPLIGQGHFSSELIDETDDGYYLSRKNEKRAIFLPRSTVSLVAFGDEQNQSSLLPSR